MRAAGTVLFTLPHGSVIIMHIGAFLKATGAREYAMGSIRDAVILAGGRGTRMLPASLYVPKETMPLLDTPIINHLIWEAARAGVSRIHLVLSERKSNFLEEFLGGGDIHDEAVRGDLPRDSLRMGVEGVTIIPHIQSDPGGMADAVSVTLDEIEGPFLVLLGDNLLIEDHVGPRHSGPNYASLASSKLVSSFEESGFPCVGVLPVRAEEICNYGVVEFSGGLVSDIVEKPMISAAPSEYVLCGRYIFPENTKEILEQYPVSEYGELQSIFLQRHLIRNGGLAAVKLDNMQMYDSGDPVAWLKSQIDHCLRRSDTGEDLSNWIEKRIGRY